MAGGIEFVSSFSCDRKYYDESGMTSTIARGIERALNTLHREGFLKNKTIVDIYFESDPRSNRNDTFNLEIKLLKEK